MRFAGGRFALCMAITFSPPHACAIRDSFDAEGILSALTTAQTELPKGWKKQSGEGGNTIYINTLNNRTTDSRPTRPASEDAADFAEEGLTEAVRSAEQSPKTDAKTQGLRNAIEECQRLEKQAPDIQRWKGEAGAKALVYAKQLLAKLHQEELTVGAHVEASDNITRRDGTIIVAAHDFGDISEVRTTGRVVKFQSAGEVVVKWADLTKLQLMELPEGWEARSVEGDNPIYVNTLNGRTTVIHPTRPASEDAAIFAEGGLTEAVRSARALAEQELTKAVQSAKTDSKTQRLWNAIERLRNAMEECRRLERQAPDIQRWKGEAGAKVLLNAKQLLDQLLQEELKPGANVEARVDIALRGGVSVAAEDHGEIIEVTSTQGRVIKFQSAGEVVVKFADLTKLQLMSEELPEGWEERSGEGGNPIYVNTLNDRTTDTRPTRPASEEELVPGAYVEALVDINLKDGKVVAAHDFGVITEVASTLTIPGRVIKFQSAGEGVVKWADLKKLHLMSEDAVAFGKAKHTKDYDGRMPERRHSLSTSDRARRGSKEKRTPTRRSSFSVPGKDTSEASLEVRIFQAIENFSATDATELSFNKGDFIFIWMQEAKGALWLYGWRQDGAGGLVPMSYLYLQELENHEHVPKVRIFQAVASFSARDATELSFKREDIMYIFPQEAQKGYDWLYARGQVGTEGEVPMNYLKALEEVERVPKVVVYQASDNFRPAEPRFGASDKLAVHKGDIIYALPQLQAKRLAVGMLVTIDDDSYPQLFGKRAKLVDQNHGGEEWSMEMLEAKRMQVPPEGLDQASGLAVGKEVTVKGKIYVLEEWIKADRKWMLRMLDPWFITLPAKVLKEAKEFAVGMEVTIDDYTSPTLHDKRAKLVYQNHGGKEWIMEMLEAKRITESPESFDQANGLAVGQEVIFKGKRYVLEEWIEADRKWMLRMLDPWFITLPARVLKEASSVGADWLHGRRQDGAQGLVPTTHLQKKGLVTLEKVPPPQAVRPLQRWPQKETATKPIDQNGETNQNRETPIYQNLEQTRKTMDPWSDQAAQARTTLTLKLPVDEGATKVACRAMHYIHDHFKPGTKVEVADNTSDPGEVHEIESVSRGYNGDLDEKEGETRSHGDKCSIVKLKEKLRKSYKAGAVLKKARTTLTLKLPLAAGATDITVNELADSDRLKPGDEVEVVDKTSRQGEVHEIEGVSRGDMGSIVKLKDGLRRSYEAGAVLKKAPVTIHRSPSMHEDAELPPALAAKRAWRRSHQEAERSQTSRLKTESGEQARTTSVLNLRITAAAPKGATKIKCWLIGDIHAHLEPGDEVEVADNATRGADGEVHVIQGVSSDDTGNIVELKEGLKKDYKAGAVLKKAPPEDVEERFVNVVGHYDASKRRLVLWNQVLHLNGVQAAPGSGVVTTNQLTALKSRAQFLEDEQQKAEEEGKPISSVAKEAIDKAEKIWPRELPGKEEGVAEVEVTVGEGETGTVLQVFKNLDAEINFEQKGRVSVKKEEMYKLKAVVKEEELQMQDSPLDESEDTPPQKLERNAQLRTAVKRRSKLDPLGAAVPEKVKAKTKAEVEREKAKAKAEVAGNKVKRKRSRKELDMTRRPVSAPDSEDEDDGNSRKSPPPSRKRRKSRDGRSDSALSGSGRSSSEDTSSPMVDDRKVVASTRSGFTKKGSETPLWSTINKDGIRRLLSSGYSSMSDEEDGEESTYQDPEQLWGSPHRMDPQGWQPAVAVN